MTVQKPEQASMRRSERRLVTRLAVAFGLVAAAELVTLVLAPGLRSLMGVYLAYSLTLIGVLLIGSISDRRRRFSSTTPAREESPSVEEGAAPAREEATSESELV